MCCPTCSTPGPLYVTLDPDCMDGDGARCRPCWASLWAHGRLHVPEAWEEAFCETCGHTAEIEEAHSLCVRCTEDAYSPRTVADPELVPAGHLGHSCADMTCGQAAEATVDGWLWTSDGWEHRDS